LKAPATPTRKAQEWHRISPLACCGSDGFACQRLFSGVGQGFACNFTQNAHIEHSGVVKPCKSSGFSTPKSSSTPTAQALFWAKMATQEPPMETVKFAMPPAFSPQERQKFQTFMREFGRVIEVRAEGVIVVVEFDDEQDALEAANIFSANDRLVVSGNGAAVRLSKASQWADDEVGLEAAVMLADEMEEAAYMTGLLEPPTRKH